MAAPLSAKFEHGQGRRFVVEAARFGSIPLAVSSIESFLLELPIRGEWWHPKSGDVVFDVGAAFGSYSLPALVDGADVYAFEPDEPLYLALTRNIARNISEKFADSWVPGWKFGAVRMALAGHVGALDYEAAATPTRFPCTTIDDFVSDGRVERLDWLKSDTEGNEAVVLRGGAETIRRCRPNILLESHKFIRADETQVLLALLVELGYAREPILIYDAGVVDYIFAPRGT